MNDVLEQLKAWKVSCGRPDLCGNAIAEIERLCVHGASILKEYGKAQEEIGRLKELLCGVEDRWRDARAEIKRLRDENGQLQTGWELATKAVDTNESLSAQRDELLEALDRIIQWAEAYPINIFHEPTPEEHKKAHELLKANGMTLDAFSASMGRHCLQGIAGIARTAYAKIEASSFSHARAPGRSRS